MIELNNLNFDKIAKIINENPEEQERNVKQFCVKSSVIPLNDFYDGYQNEVKNILSEITPSKDRPSISDFVDIFKVFDTYPTNMQKTKRPGKELQRINSTTSAVPVEEDPIAAGTNADAGKVTSEEIPSARNTYKHFLAFQQKLAKLREDLAQQQGATSYANKLRQLNSFANELEKLLPAIETGEQAFSSAEEAKLRQLVTSMEAFNFIQRNNDLFSGVGISHTPRFDDLSEIMSHLINSINYYNVFQ